MTLSHENSTWLYVRAFVDELARTGVQDVCLCPGSRSAPLAMTFAADKRFRLWMHLDERACAFFGLGLAKASHRPVVLVCTSGTAAANFFPAVAEASLAHVPLIVLTADRPPELRDTGAPQTIDQIKLYGAYPKWFVEMGLPEGTAELLRYARTTACRAAATATKAPTGVVHLNMPFREPPVPLPVEISPDTPQIETFLGRADGRPFVTIAAEPAAPDSSTIGLLAQALRETERGLIVTGMQDDEAFPEAVTQLAKRLGYPVLADPLSQVRCGTHDREFVIDTYDAFLRDPDIVKRVAPKVMLRFGAIPTSKPLLLYMQHYAAARQILVGQGEWNEPAQIASDSIIADAVLFCREMVRELEAPDARDESAPGAPAPAAETARGAKDASLATATGDSVWLAEWRNLNSKAKCAMQEQVREFGEFFEGRVFMELAECMPDGGTCFASSSMPVRDLDTFFPAGERQVRFLSNRGVNGIDGVVSTALGAGAARRGPLVLVIGDIALYHDLNGLLAAKQHHLDAVIVLINNDGGGIFSFLPQAAHPEYFETLFGTPHGLNFEHAAQLYDARYCPAEDWGAFRAAVQTGIGKGGLVLVEVKTDRANNVTMHRQVWKAVSRVLAEQA